MLESGPRQLAVSALLLAVVAILGVRFMAGQRAQAESSRVASVPASTSRGEGRGPGSVRLEGVGGGAIVVHVAGAVRRPGVYRLRGGQRVQDAVRRAGGPGARADLNGLNLAARVADGQQVVVPRRAPTATATAAAAGAAAPGAPVSLNSATAEQLDTLDGVGPATIKRILDWRREHGGFRSIDDLGQVPGIGPKRLAALRERVQP